MSAISEKLALLLHTKSDLKASLIEKGQSVTEESVFADYADKVRAIETGTALPTLADPGAADDLAAGKQLIAQDGSVVTGNVQTVTQGGAYRYPGQIPELSGDQIFTSLVFPKNVLFRTGGIAKTWIVASDLGNATAADVAAGKTFTSAAGVKVTGTASISPETIEFNVVNNTIHQVEVWYGHNNFGGCPAGESCTVPVEEGGVVAIVCAEGVFGIEDYTGNVYIRFVMAFNGNACLVVNVNTNDPATGTSPGTPTITLSD